LLYLVYLGFAFDMSRGSFGLSKTVIYTNLTVTDELAEGFSKGPMLQNEGWHEGERDADDGQEEVTGCQIGQQHVGDSPHVCGCVHRDENKSIAENGGHEYQ
jgi:hypothetical protein